MDPGPSTSTGGFTNAGQGELSTLEGLGVIYDQTELEDDILGDIDDQMRTRERIDKDKQLQDITEELKQTRLRIKTIDDHLSTIKDDSSLSKAVRKNIQMIKREKENKEKQLRKLEAKLRSLKIYLGHEDIPNSEEVDDETRHQLQMLLGDEETENDKKIKSGEITPFGMVRSLKLPEVDMFDRFLDEEIENGKKKQRKKTPRSDTGQPKQTMMTTAKASKRSSDVGTELDLLRPKKKKPRYRDLPLGSTREYIPENRLRLSDECQKERSQSPGAEEQLYSNEDSDYDPAKERESSIETDIDEEDDDDYESAGRTTKRNKKGCIDDGDFRSYQRRIRDLPEDSDCSDEDVDEDFRMPCFVWNKLYRYQQTCVKWLWELHQFKCGGIIGDEMGLGKTVQAISFLRGLRHSNMKPPGEMYRGLGPVILVAPATVMHQWVKEFHKWFPKQRVGILHNSGSYSGRKKSVLVEEIHSSKGTLITSYQGIVMYLDDLLQHHWHYIILDEGHKIRNPDAQATLAVKQFRTPHRLILSGSPIQNNLRELWSLFDFVFPGKLGTLPVFMAEFAVPITHGGYANATETQVAVGYRCATILRDTIKPYLLRRMKSDVKTSINLPPKNEQVIFCKLTERQRDLYKEYVDSHEVKKILDGRVQVFVGLINLRKICNHPDLYDGGPDKEIVPTNLSKVTERPAAVEDRTESVGTFGYYKRSGKLMVVDALLKLWNKQNHRVLLFTQSRQMLRILEEFVQRRGYAYLTMDGTTTIGSRQPTIDRFNRDSSIFVFILTTRVGGLGVNLTGANRVIIYDPDWNPSTDMQARERAWRIGQQKDVTIYRLMTAGTIEEKIYHRQIFKQFLTNRILKNPKQRRFFKTNELYELFTLSDDMSKKQRTETSDIFAGTGSTVDRKRLKSLEKKQRRLEEDARKQRMRELAKRLSQKIGCGEKISAADFEEESTTSGTLRLDGVEIEGATRKSRYKNETEDQEEDTMANNDYILAKLFKNSKVHSVMKHDKIMESAVPDGSLVESEAHQVAQDAIKKLKEARRLCYSANDGVPNWTGRRGAFRGRTKAVFGTKVLKNIPSTAHSPDSKKFKKTISVRKKEKREASCFTYTSEKLHAQKVTSSADLMKQLKARTICSADIEKVSDDEDHGDGDDGTNGTNDGNIDLSDPPTRADELIVDLRTFIAIESDVNGQASTEEILNRFRDSVSKSKATLFKSLLKKLCEFHRENNGGIWKLRPEFR